MSIDANPKIYKILSNILYMYKENTILLLYICFVKKNISCNVKLQFKKLKCKLCFILPVLKSMYFI